MKPFLRFPGGKSKQVQKILQYFKLVENEYREPFIGGGSVYLGGEFQNAWINDIDPGVYDLWRMVKEEPRVLIQLIKEHTLILYSEKSLELWKRIQRDLDFVPRGYRTLFLSKTCFNGVINGGPIGGSEQSGRYKIYSRWAKNQTIQRIIKANELLQNCKITNLSWEDVVEESGSDVVLYLDPPYLRFKSSYDEYDTVKQN